jgi:hypothetical protein
MAMETLKRLAQRLRSGKSEPESPWRASVTLDRGTLGESCLALDGQGQGSALWENSGRIWTMPIGPRTTPGIVRLPLGEGTNPRIVLNADGRGMALWQTVLRGERQILGMVLGGEEDTTHVVFRTHGLIHHLQAAVDRRGSALVVWLHDLGGRLEVMAQSFDVRGLAWERPPTTLGIPAHTAVEPRIAVNYKLQAMVVWEAEGDATGGLVASHYWPSESIWSDRPMPVVAHATSHHQVKMDDLGNALALWVHAPRGQRSSLEASLYDGLSSEWREPVTLSHAQSFSPPRLVMSGEGQALAAWCQTEGQGASRLFAKGFSKGVWETGVEAFELGFGPVHDFSLDIAPGGEAGLLAVHHGPEGDLVSARLRGWGWSSAIPLAPPSLAPCSSPQLRICPQGASATWVRTGGRDSNLLLAETR